MSPKASLAILPIRTIAELADGPGERKSLTFVFFNRRRSSCVKVT
jgi:hypothetical protein